MGIKKPRIKILGQELAGEIESAGKNVKHFKKGDLVFAATAMRLGAYAEFACLPVKGAIAIKPVNMSFEEASTVPFGGREALHFLRKADIRSGQKILINGAGGSIGTFGVQLARQFGAEVTAVDSAEKLEMLRSIGAERVIDYKQEDYTESGETYDVIFDVVGKAQLSRSNKSLKQNGRYLLANPSLRQMIRGLWTSITTDKKVTLQPTNGTIEDLIFLRELIMDGKITTVIDRSYPLEQTAEAHRYIETGQKLGNVVISVGHPDDV